MKKKREPDDIAARRGHVLVAARMVYRRLKRRRLLMDVSLYPDKSPEIVAVLAAFAYDVHTYLKRQERATSGPDR